MRTGETELKSRRQVQRPPYRYCTEQQGSHRHVVAEEHIGPMESYSRNQGEKTKEADARSADEDRRKGRSPGAALTKTEKRGKTGTGL